jgi:hypothetical protein
VESRLAMRGGWSVGSPSRDSRHRGPFLFAQIGGVVSRRAIR